MRKREFEDFPVRPGRVGPGQVGPGRAGPGRVGAIRLANPLCRIILRRPAGAVAVGAASAEYPEWGDFAGKDLLAKDLLGKDFGGKGFGREMTLEGRREGLW